CRRTLCSGQINHDGLEDSASHPSTNSLALRARGCFRWSRTRGGSACWEGLRCSRRTLSYCHRPHGLVWRDGPRPRSLTPFTSEPWLLFPAAGSVRRVRGDSCALPPPLPDNVCIIGADRVLAQCLATEGGGSAAGERATLAEPYRSAAAVGMGCGSGWRVRLLQYTVDNLHRYAGERVARLGVDGGTASGRSRAYPAILDRIRGRASAL